MISSNYEVVFAVIILLTLLVVAIRVQARAGLRPKKDLCLRTRFDERIERSGASPSTDSGASSSAPSLKLPRREPKA